MTRYLITGAAGMLGQDLQRSLAGRDVTALSRADLDVTDQAAVSDAVAGHDVVVNAAAYTKVDDAESDEDAAAAVNARGPEVLATAVAATGARLVQVSTDYVFDGTGTTPYAEDEPTRPLGAYGRTKSAGEAAVRSVAPDRSYIVRTAWLYGAGGPTSSKIARVKSNQEARPPFVPW